jgi:hypothetical protein
MKAADWDHLTEAEKAATILARVRAGHTAVGRHQRQLVRDAREQAFDEAIGFLAAQGFAEASAALEAAAFEVAG